MEWHRLISDIRLGMEEYHDPRTHTRNDFQRDYDRLVFSSPFRRLQNKTQVFPLPGSVFVHNRLTHSLEVSSVGRSMAAEAALMLYERHKAEPDAQKFFVLGDITATACLCHDLGNPPFGHSGEKTIATFFSEGPGMELKGSLTDAEWADFVNFDGNANSFRLLTHQFVGRRKGGFAMTYSTLASIVKYPFTSLNSPKRGKFGFFESEREIYERVARTLGIDEIEKGRFARHPLVWLMEAADDICYQIMDLEDAHRLKILSTAETAEIMLNFFEPKERDKRVMSMRRLDDPNEQIGYLRSKVIGELVSSCSRSFVEHEEEILAGTMTKSLVSLSSPTLREAYDTSAELSAERIYRSSEVVEIEIAGNRILTYLMEVLTDAVMHPNKNFSKLLLKKVPDQYDIHAHDTYGRLQAVLDHVSGMTDIYALDLFRKLNGHSLPQV
ncbi:MAG: dNTP triphosphohydrolase [Muribaculaceae bacterium]|nr:dNTP triphosphohydrolase [Muribaculaceae bacterium]